jgi:hypothetical protein
MTDEAADAPSQRDGDPERRSSQSAPKGGKTGSTLALYRYFPVSRFWPLSIRSDSRSRPRRGDRA